MGLFTYMASLDATWLPLPWRYPAEILSVKTHVKTHAKTNALSTYFNWSFNLMVVMVTPVLDSHIYWGA